MKKTFAILTLLLFTAAANAQAIWNIDKSHTQLQFEVSHMVITDVTGHFKSYEGTVTTPSADNLEGAEISFTIDAASIDTDNADRDEHLRNADFFDVETYPEITFVSKSFEKTDEGEYKLVGDLTMKGITKEVELDVELNGIVTGPWGNTRAGFEVEGEINRFDYNIEWSKSLDTGSLVVGEMVEIDINLQLILDKGE